MDNGNQSKVLLHPLTGLAWQSNWIALSLSLIVLIILISQQIKSVGSDSELWTCDILYGHIVLGRYF